MFIFLLATNCARIGGATDGGLIYQTPGAKQLGLEAVHHHPVAVT
jgi:hypothetical protein